MRIQICIDSVSQNFEKNFLKNYIEKIEYSMGAGRVFILTRYLQSNLDIANKSIRPFLFTILNNSLYQMA